jgi:hypothetical protein
MHIPQTIAVGNDRRPRHAKVKGLAGVPVRKDTCWIVQGASGAKDQCAEHVVERFGSRG